APWRVAILDNLIRKRQHLIPGLWDFIAGLVEGLLGIEDDALDVDAVEDTAQDHLAVGIGGRVGVDKALVVVLLQPVGLDETVEVDQLALLSIACHHARLREVDDILDRAALRFNGDRLGGAAGNQLDGDAGLLLEVLPLGFEFVLFIARQAVEQADRRALVLAGKRVGQLLTDLTVVDGAAGRRRGLGGRLGGGCPGSCRRLSSGRGRRGGRRLGGRGGWRGGWRLGGGWGGRRCRSGRSLCGTTATTGGQNQAGDHRQQHERKALLVHWICPPNNRC